MSREKTITIRMRMAASKVKDENGVPVQFLGTGFINRWGDGRGCSPSPSAAAVPMMLYGLKWTQGEIDVDVTISLEPFDQARVMWCLGYRVESRIVTPYKPYDVKEYETEDGDSGVEAMMRGGSFYLDNWTCERYFEQIPAGTVFPVYVSVKRASKTKKRATKD